MTERLGLTEAVSFALGGIIGGGIFAAPGVVARVSGPTAWVVCLVAGIVVMATGYSYVKLDDLASATEASGGAVAFIETFLHRPTLAGMVGWTLRSATSARWRCTPTRSARISVPSSTSSDSRSSAFRRARSFRFSSSLASSDSTSLASTSPEWSRTSSSPFGHGNGDTSVRPSCR
ncbi:hypothetical protein V5735_16965 (plasmid) [Haladaptatus sp. SPP-AMP-3]|uniref:amino acid permease n=1 Tax=Haladaptatus sp. SPP-AMP-3 TaxID=3121295 RepID=UPI003C2E81A1